MQVLKNCDLVLLDLKMTNDEDYRVHIGCGIDAPLAFLDELEKRRIPCWIRHVVVGGLNDTEENICALRNLLKEKPVLKKSNCCLSKNCVRRNTSAWASPFLLCILTSQHRKNEATE